LVSECTEEKDTDRIKSNAEKFKKKVKVATAKAAVSTEMNKQMNNQIKIEVINTDCQGYALIDTGSDTSFISECMCKKLYNMGIATHEDDKVIELANGQHHSLSKYMNLMVCTVESKPKTIKMKCYVMKMKWDFIMDGWTAETAGLVELHGESACDSRGYINKVCMWPTDIADTEDGNSNTNSADIPDMDEVKEDISSRIADGDMKREISNLINQYIHVFDGDMTKPAKVKEFSIKIEKDATVPYQPPRALSSPMEKMVREEIQQLLELNIIRPSNSRYVSPIVMVISKNGKRRMCVDYREVNMRTIPLRYPVRNSRAILERVLGSTIFASIDLQKGYHQIAMAEDSIPFTAFNVPWNTYEYIRLPFGVRNGPSFFQQVMDDVLGGLLHHGVEVFIDDILVHGKTEAEFLEILEKVLVRLSEYNLKAKVSKSLFGFSDIEYIGYHIDGEGFTVTAKHKDAIADMEVPKTKKDVRSMNGLFNYFKMFIHRYSWICKPLFQAASGRGPLEWTEECQRAMNQIKDEINKVTKLYFIDYSKDIYLSTDASNKGVGGVLYQKGIPSNRYIVFMSLAFNDTQKNWSTIEQEAFGIYYCITQCERYLLGAKPFKLETDHRNLLWMEKSKQPKIIRWMNRLSEYVYETSHVPGRDNVIADTLSRLPAVAAVDIVRDLHGDMHEWLEEKRYYKIMESVHGGAIGHRSVLQMLKILKESGASWHNMDEDVKEYVKHCVVCQKNSKYSNKKAITAYHIESTEPFQRLCIDTMGPLPMDKCKNKYIIVIIDIFTRYVELFACKNVTAVEAANCLVSIFGRYGIPESILSDKGSQYVNQVIDKLLSICEVKHNTTVPYRHEGNGIVERVNHEVMNHLRNIIYDNNVYDTWSNYLPCVQYVVNTYQHSTIGCTPMQLVYGSKLTEHRGLVRQFRQSSEGDMGEYITELDKSLETISESSRHFREEHQKKLDSSIDKYTMVYNIGDRVLIKCVGIQDKLKPKWEGPYIVVHTTRRTLKVKNANCDKYQDVDVDRVKLFHRGNGEVLSDEQIAAYDKHKYIVESVVEHKGDLKKKNKCVFLIKWQGYDTPTWEPYRNLNNNVVLEDYLKSL